ncbi:MAG: hypothetical protein OEO19_20375, partial [Gammaproteobacteria bacterium]|nr:hypothetical protein [Gammaproteobacteria bacterium]
MTVPRIKQQAGYALMLMVLGLMGVGGVVVAGFTQQAKQDVEQLRYQRNQHVLAEAKQALLLYAYRYPEITGNPNRGPGRLPCPDTDNTGTPNPDIGTYCIDAGVAMVGRFPWRANGMEFYDARDASGQRLWYAVSQDFNNVDNGSVINSDLTGSITIHDQNGRLMYDGAVEGIAAVIIAPGPAIDRNGVLQDRSIGNGDNPNDTIADTDPGIVNPANYLDLFGALDNTDFINDDSNNGFVLGPIDDLAADELIVNDQLILITAEEVIAMAQKATLQAYREAIEAYLGRPGFGRYPWLDPYDSADGLATYDAQINPAPPAPVIGRVPSIFGNYFDTNSTDSEAIRSEIEMLLDVDGHPVSVRVPASATPDVFFKANGNLSTSFNSGVSFTGYVWDGHTSNTPTLPNDGIWEACPYVTGTEEDCNQNTSGDFIGMGGSTPGESDVWLQVRQVTFTVSSAGNPFEFPNGFKTATPLVYTAPEAVRHAYVTAEYTGAGASYISTVTWVGDNDFKASFSEFPIPNIGSLTFDVGDTINVGVRYYPELPRWAQTNGWHDMLQAAYSSEVRPGGDNVCTPGVDCLTLQDVGGITNNKRALLVLSGGVGDLDPLDVDFTDAGGGPNYYADDLNLIFEDE